MNRTYVSHSVVPYLPTSLRIRFISNGGENDHKPNPQANKKEKYPEVHEWVSETAYANLQTIRKSYEKLEPFLYHTLYYSILYIKLYYTLWILHYKYYIILHIKLLYHLWTIVNSQTILNKTAGRLFCKRHTTFEPAIYSKVA